MWKASLRKEAKKQAKGVRPRSFQIVKRVQFQHRPKWERSCMQQDPILRLSKASAFDSEISQICFHSLLSQLSLHIFTGGPCCATCTMCKQSDRVSGNGIWFRPRIGNGPPLKMFHWLPNIWQRFGDLSYRKLLLQDVKMQIFKWWYLSIPLFWKRLKCMTKFSF